MDFVVSGVVVVFISIFSFFVVNHGIGFTLVIVIDLFVIVLLFIFSICDFDPDIWKTFVKLQCFFTVNTVCPAALTSRSEVDPLGYVALIFSIYKRKQAARGSCNITLDHVARPNRIRGGTELTEPHNCN